MKKTKTILIATLVVASVFLLTPLSVDAGSRRDSNITLTLNASRPLLTGSPRGTTRVITNNATSQAIRPQTIVYNTNNTRVFPRNGWTVRTAAVGTLSNNVSSVSSQTIGSTRGGTVRGEAQRRGSSSGAWSTALRYSRAF